MIIGKNSGEHFIKTKERNMSTYLWISIFNYFLKPSVGYKILSAILRSLSLQQLHNVNLAMELLAEGGLLNFPVNSEGESWHANLPGIEFLTSQFSKSLGNCRKQVLEMTLTHFIIWLPYSSSCRMNGRGNKILFFWKIIISIIKKLDCYKFGKFSINLSCLVIQYLLKI